MKKLELILLAGALIGLLLGLLKVHYLSPVASIFLLVLGTIYLYLGFALFNEIPFGKIFKPESYKSLGKWRLGIAIGTGIGLSQLTIGFLFAINKYPMTRSFLSLGLIITALMLLLALIRNTREKHRFYMIISLRCAAFIIVGAVVLLLYVQQV
jgi:putative Mn2+ efflux pump MntP